MTVTIKKLTPPQVEAMCGAFPASVQMGWLTTTASQVTFADVPGKERWRLEHVRRLLGHMVKVEAPSAQRSYLEKILIKTYDRPDLVVEA